MRPSPPPPAGLERWRLPAVLLVVLVYTVPLGGAPPATNPNELSRLQLTAALGLWASPEISPVVELWGMSQDHSVRDGRLYSDKAPGLSLVAVPALWLLRPVLPRREEVPTPDYWPLRHALTWLLVALPAALLPFWLVDQVPTLPARLRLPLALLLALATPWLTYGTVFLGHVPAGVLIAVAWILALRPGHPRSTPLPGRALAAGVAAGFAVTTEYPCAILVAVIAVGFLLRRPSAAATGALLAGLALGLAPALLYHQAAFASPLATGYSFKADVMHAAYHAQGVAGVTWPSLERLWGVLLSPRRGLLFFCPALALALPGAFRAIRRDRREGLLLAAGIGLYVLFGAGFVDWEAGWSAAARHLTPILPLLWLAVGEEATALARSSRGWLLLAPLAGLGAAAALLSIALTPFFPEILTDPLGELVLPSLAAGAAAPGLLSAITGWPPLAGFLVEVLLVATGVGAAVAAGAPTATGRVAAATAAVAGAIVFAAAVRVAAPPADDVQLLARAVVLRRIGAEPAARRLEEQLGLLRPAWPP